MIGQRFWPRPDGLGTGLLQMITKQQYRKLMSEYQETGNVTVSAMKADMSRPTARKYLDERSKCRMSCKPSTLGERAKIAWWRSGRKPW
jgi:response regulator of citrate/malate metabolism